jgi:hypothetical protein
MWSMNKTLFFRKDWVCAPMEALPHHQYLFRQDPTSEPTGHYNQKPRSALFVWLRKRHSCHRWRRIRRPCGSFR